VEVLDAKAIILYVPYKLLNSFDKIQKRDSLVRELEKKFFSGLDAPLLLIITQNVSFGESPTSETPKPRRTSSSFSRTLTAVQGAILDDIVYPTEILGKRTRVKTDGRRIDKVILDSKDQANVKTKTEVFSAVYNKLTNKMVVFSSG
jgi:small subunit ribosomal protein S7e